MVQTLRAIRWMDAKEDPDETFRNGMGKCEMCGQSLPKDPEQIFISLRVYGNKPDKMILFTCNRCEPLGYDIQLSRFLSSDEGPVEWLSHLCEKTWLDTDLALRLLKAMVKVRDLMEWIRRERENSESLPR